MLALTNIILNVSRVYDAACYVQFYAGFLVTSVLGDEFDGIHCGIAVSPITDWRYYGNYFNIFI